MAALLDSSNTLESHGSVWNTSPPDNHMGMYSFTRLGPGCGDARVGETSKCFAHSTAYSVFTCKNSTGRSPNFVFGVLDPLCFKTHLSGSELD